MTTLRIHVMVHSGMPDPVAELGSEPSAALLNALAPDRPLTDDDLGLPPPWHLGYRGMRIDQLADPDPRFPLTFDFGTDALRGPGLNHAVAQPLTDERLLSPDGPVGRLLPQQLVERIPELLRSARATSRTASDKRGDPPTPCGESAPTADLAWWNDGSVGSNAHQRYNNCYNYGTNRRTDTFAQPGRGSGLYLSQPTLTATRVQLYAWYDNLYDAPAADNVCISSGHLAALAFANYTPPDYHWWRKNRDGYWSHKPGQDAATDRDHSGQLIADPRACNRGPYTTWVGFMAVIPGHVRIA